MHETKDRAGNTGKTKTAAPKQNCSVHTAAAMHKQQQQPRRFLKKKGTKFNILLLSVEAPSRFELEHRGFADLCLTAWLWRQVWSGRRDSNSRHPPWQGGTLPLSYYRIKWCLGAESNHRHVDFQSTALPTELPRHNGDPEGARTLDLQRDRLAF